MSDSAAQNRTPKLDHLLSKVGGVWWIARQQAEEELAGLLDESERLRECLEEAADWLDADLADTPDVPTAQADRELVARWRAALETA